MRLSVKLRNFRSFGFFNESLLSHGQGPLRSYSFGLRRAGSLSRGIRISHGGYKQSKFILRYPGIATHIGLGNFTISFVNSRY
jgi:hypothetical protein